MISSEISSAAAALGRLKAGKKERKSEAKAASSKSNGARGGRATWHPAPKRGCRNPQSELFRFTVVRLSDMSERFTDRKPSPSVVRSSDFTVWDNRENAEIR